MRHADGTDWLQGGHANMLGICSVRGLREKPCPQLALISPMASGMSSVRTKVPLATCALVAGDSRSLETSSIAGPDVEARTYG